MRIFQSRRAVTAILGIGALLAMALVKGMDTSMAIASIAIAVAGANAAQNMGGKNERHIDDAT
jgi:hypothetical protein